MTSVPTAKLDKFRDECGVVGVAGHPDAANLAYLSLYAMQHRGQESCGIASRDSDAMHVYRGMGYVAENSDTEALRKYPDPLSKAFREAYAKRHDYPNADWVIAGNGMDDRHGVGRRFHVEVPFELLVGGQRDGGEFGPAEIDRHPVRLLVIEGGKNTFAMCPGHGSAPPVSDD